MSVGVSCVCVCKDRLVNVESRGLHSGFFFYHDGLNTGIHFEYYDMLAVRGLKVIQKGW